jgi:hypothetical protein
MSETFSRWQMALLDKNNPEATATSALRAAAVSAACGGVVFFLAFKSQYIEAWKIALPLWMLLCAAVGAVWEWQVPKGSNESEGKN